MEHNDEIEYLEFLYEFLTEQYSRTHDPELIAVIAEIMERCDELIKRSALARTAVAVLASNGVGLSYFGI